MAKAFIEISIDFKEEPTKCEPCVVCEDLIFSKVYRMVVLVGNTREETNIILCNSCFDAFSKQD